MATTTATQIQQLYVGLLGRAADQGGLNWWADQVTTGGKTLEDVRASFVTSTEYTTTYGAAATRADLVTSIYQNLFERTPSADEVKYWAETDTRPADQLVAAFIEFAGAADQAVINNKTFVAQTYTDTAGTDFNKATAAAVIAEVDGTSASVSAALENLNSGSLPGQVPGVGLINTLAAAQAAEVKFDADNAAAIDDLATTLELKGTAAYDNLTSVALKLQAVSKAADTARETASGEKSTSVLAVRVKDSVKALGVERAKIDATKAATYEAAYAKVQSTDAAEKNDVTVAQAALNADADFATALDKANVALGFTGTPAPDAIADVGDLYDFYVDATTTPEQRSNVDTAFTGINAYATFKSTASIDVADKAADAALNTATTGLPSAFTEAVSDAASWQKQYDDAKAADITKAAADALVDSRDAAGTAIDNAETALAQYNSTHTDTKVVALASVAASETVKEAFYFAAKATADDFTIGNTTASSHFGAGDAIVLGTDYSYNSGALSTGDNNKLEFFFVKTTTGTQVVIETANYGSGAVTPSATTGVTAAADDNLAVITLTGVTADHLSVNNGVISYV